MKTLYSPRLSATFVLGGVATEQLMRPSPHNRGGVGKLPSSSSEALGIINGLRAEGAEPLTEADVHIHYLEAANDNFVSDRYCFLGEDTLRNIATDAAAGFAFMNSHRTGRGWSPSELPLGRTFCGRYETLPATEGEEGSATRRAVVGIYMLRGVTPNGASGPSTDDMHRMIDARTIFDCSVGLIGGEQICDVCGHGVWAYDEEYRYLCPHVPGTTYRMTDDEMKAQVAKGVPDGRASYTVANAGCNEVSAVWDGAVPGAGFAKAATLSLPEDQRLDITEKLSVGYRLRFSVSDLDALAETIQGDKRGKFTLPQSEAQHEPTTTPEAEPGKKDKSPMKFTLKALREKLGLGENDPIEIEDQAPAPAPAPADFSAQVASALEAALAPITARVESLSTELANSQKQAADSAHAARFAQAESRVGAARRGLKLTKAAGDKLLAYAKEGQWERFEAGMEIAETNGSVTMLGGAPIPGTDDPTIDALGGDSTQLATTMKAKAEKLSRERGISLYDAMTQLATDPEFSAEYNQSRQEETAR